MIKIFRTLVVVFLLSTFPVFLSAQGKLRHPKYRRDPRTAGKVNHGVNNPIGAPIEDGVGILILLSIGYTMKKGHGLLKNKNQIDQVNFKE